MSQLRKGERIAKHLARAGLCSRREAERMIAEGRVVVDGTTLETPAFLVTSESQVKVDGKPIAGANRRNSGATTRRLALLLAIRMCKGGPPCSKVYPKASVGFYQWAALI